MSVPSMILPSTRALYTGTIAATGATPVLNLPYGESYLLQTNVTASAGTVDIVLQHSPDNGTTWLNLPLKFAQIAAGPGQAYLAFKPAIGLSDAGTAGQAAATGGVQAANIPFNVKWTRAFVTLGTAGTTTFTIYCTTSPKGAVAE